MLARSLVMKASGAAITGDPLFSSVSLLLRGDAPILIDSSSRPKTITTEGGAGFTSSFARFGGGSINFPLQSRLNVPAGEDFKYSTGPFTHEAWIRPTKSYSVIFSQTTSGQNYFMLVVEQDNRLTFRFGTGGGTAITGATAMLLNVWHHVAVCRENTGTNQTRLFLNGQLDASGTCAFDFSNTTFGLAFGNYTHALDIIPFEGQIDEARITKAARYTGSFVPTGPFPDFQ